MANLDITVFLDSFVHLIIPASQNKDLQNIKAHKFRKNSPGDTIFDNQIVCGEKRQTS